MSTDPHLLLDTIEPPAQQLLFLLLATAFGLVLGMAIGITLMSDLLTTLGG
jgi:hypothetical protein